MPTLILSPIAFFKNVTDVLSDDTSVTLKQFCHLVNGQPDSIIDQMKNARPFLLIGYSTYDLLLKQPVS
ncbi:MAG: hypothetical protein RSE55_05205, partial [Lachnospiraceae bacterium]